MTKETKIGLLVGLTFIIVFAIILSEKGPSARNTAVPAFTVAQASRPGGADNPSQPPLSRAGRLPVDGQLAPIIQPAVGINPALPMREEEVAQVAEVVEKDLPPLPQSVISLINGALPPAAEPSQTGLAQAQTGRPAESPMTGRARQEAIQIASAEPPPANADTAPVADGTAGSPASVTTVPVAAGSSTDLSGRPSLAGADAFQTKFLGIKTVHVVEKGESLGKIAAKFYGRSNPERIDAIFDVNRDKLKDRHSVKAGQKLKIPDLGTASGEFEAAPEFSIRPVEIDSVQDLAAADRSVASTPVRGDATVPDGPAVDRAVRIPTPIDAALAQGRSTASARQTPDRSSRSAQADRGGFRLYEVKPADTLSRIAKRELGSDRLYGEIYRLNKDVLTDKNRLKPGMKLRLPQPSAATTDSQLMLSSTQLDDAP